MILETNCTNISPSNILEKRERGRIQGLSNFLGYPLLSKERLKLRTSNLARTLIGSIGSVVINSPSYYLNNIGNSVTFSSTNMNKLVIKILQGSVVTQTVLGGLPIHRTVANFLQCICAKNYANWLAVDGVSATITRLTFLPTLYIDVSEHRGAISSYFRFWVFLHHSTDLDKLYTMV